MRCSVTAIAETSDVDQEPQNVEVLKEHFTELMDALVELEGLDDRLSNADMSVCLAEHRATFSIDVEADSLDKGVEIARGAIRTAIHTAGGHTPGWEKHRWTVEFDEEGGEVLVDN